MEELPKCTEVRIHRGGDGKVAIMEYGKVSSGYSVNVTRTYRIPEDWSDREVEQFEDTQLEIMKERIDYILDKEFTERWEQRQW